MWVPCAICPAGFFAVGDALGAGDEAEAEPDGAPAPVLEAVAEGVAAASAPPGDEPNVITAPAVTAASATSPVTAAASPHDGLCRP